MFSYRKNTRNISAAASEKCTAGPGFWNVRTNGTGAHSVVMIPANADPALLSMLGTMSSANQAMITKDPAGNYVVSANVSEQWLLVLDETNDIQLQRVQYKDGESISETLDAEREKVELDRNLFWVKDLKKRHTILSLDMAETLIRRGVTGLGLCEVELYSKK